MCRVEVMLQADADMLAGGDVSAGWQLMLEAACLLNGKIVKYTFCMQGVCAISGVVHEHGFCRVKCSEG